MIKDNMKQFFETNETSNVKYFNEKFNHLKSIFGDQDSRSFKNLKELTGWDEYSLTIVLKNLIDNEIIEEYLDEELGKIIYRNSNVHDELLTLEQRLNKFNKQ